MRSPHTAETCCGLKVCMLSEEGQFSRVCPVFRAALKTESRILTLMAAISCSAESVLSSGSPFVGTFWSSRLSGLQQMTWWSIPPSFVCTERHRGCPPAHCAVAMPRLGGSGPSPACLSRILNRCCQLVSQAHAPAHLQKERLSYSQCKHQQNHGFE